MNRRIALFLALLLCAAAVAAFAAEAGKTAAELRADAQQLLLKQAEMGWNTWVLGQSSDQAALYRPYSHLFTRESIATVKAALAAEKNPDQQRALGYFLRYLEVEYIGNQTAELWDIESDLEANEVALVDGKLVAYRDLHGLQANEPDAKRRADISKEEYRIYRLLNDVVLKRIWAASHRLAKELGYKDYLDLSANYRMIDLEALNAKAQEFLALSESYYLKLFDEVSPIPRQDFRRSDIARLLGAKDFDQYFPADKLLPNAFATFDAMGLGDVARRRVLVHSEPLPKKNPRAVCFAIRVPSDVRMSIKPLGGADDYASLYHEFGHALHFANGRTPIWEFQQLGSNAATEGYAYTLESLHERGAWLAKHTTMPPDKRQAFAKRVMFGKLYMARRYMAKLAYETEFHRGVADPAKRYQHWLSKAYGFQLTDDESTRCLTDLDPFLYAADYVQAFYLEAMMDSYLKAHFGKTWWENKKTGAFLTGLWQDANKWSGAEIVQKLGFKDYDPGVLFKYLTAAE